jgi:cyclopropane fatty-acyl-phospholipid synthase-like methyltransferase
MSILILGAGWGTTALQLSHHLPSLTITCQSPLPRQRAFIQRWCRLSNTTNIHPLPDLHWRDILITHEEYDRIVWADWTVSTIGVKNMYLFAYQCYAALKPGGRVYLETSSVVSLSWVMVQWLAHGDRWMMPGGDGMLVSIHSVIRALESVGFRVALLDNQTDAMIATMERWLENLKRNQRWLSELYDER